MKEITITLAFCLAAASLVAAALIVDPGAMVPEIFSDQGQAFYPDFTDPQAPKTIEVVDYDEETATTQPLKVEFRNKQWIVPSHFGYPADAENRLANTAAALMELRKDSVASDLAEDHARFGVIDPLDTKSASLAGRGKRVTLRDADGAVLADFIVGKEVEDKAGYRYMRVPNKRRTYAVRTEADVSARFNDWIETSLLKLQAPDIRRVVIHRYSINEMMGVLENVEDVILTRDKEKDRWTISGGGAPRKEKADALAASLENLRIVDVQPKPAGLTQDLKTKEGIRLSAESVLSLREKGFFITPHGQLLSNEGEVIVETANGILYTLRFGEIASGAPAPLSGGEKTGGSEGEGQTETEEDDSRQEQRYLFITAGYSEERARQYADGKEPDGKGRTLERELRDRFAGWYYVISGADFEKLRPGRRELMR